jgi:hypothetical protein
MQLGAEYRVENTSSQLLPSSATGDSGVNCFKLAFRMSRQADTNQRAREKPYLRPQFAGPVERDEPA